MLKLKKAILDVVGDRILKPVRIHSVEVISEHFRLIHLESPLFEKEIFRPGAKVQINTGDWNVRTYTPLALDQRTGKLSILAFLHGNGPGSEWASVAKAGDLCQVLGPRSSLNLENPEAIFLFGDETSFALASTFKKHFGDLPHSRFVFEVSSVKESLALAERFQFHENALFYTRQIDGSHLDKVLEKLEQSVTAVPSGEFVFTGNAKSIQRLRNGLRERKKAAKSTQLKAYWAFGKVGLD